jgi:hypothetical protein
MVSFRKVMKFKENKEMIFLMVQREMITFQVVGALILSTAVWEMMN